MAGPLEALFASARLLALDVDGVLTDGRIMYADATEMQCFHVHDGQALVWLRRAGVEVAWISGRGSGATLKRAQELGVRHLQLQVKNKAQALSQVQERLGIAPSATIAMGDDFPDLCMSACAALFVAPANARAEVRARAGLVLACAGGEGAVRELAELLLKARGRFQELLEVAPGS
jgi:3-deoxy-D-manno-octulosonate 8-phosphate phosphatase (KDO 8-P phosphatase)